MGVETSLSQEISDIPGHTVLSAQGRHHRPEGNRKAVPAEVTRNDRDATKRYVAGVGQEAGAGVHRPSIGQSLGPHEAGRSHQVKSMSGGGCNKQHLSLKEGKAPPTPPHCWGTAEAAVSLLGGLPGVYERVSASPADGQNLMTLLAATGTDYGV